MKRLEAPSLTHRYVPNRDFPPYSYVPGYHPHPLDDPEGHSFGLDERNLPEPDPSHWQDCEDYLYGIDLFNYGYYWEAHEIWEEVWNACGRTGKSADFFKGLIKLAASGVKVRTNTPNGVLAHSVGAVEQFHKVKASQNETESFMGLDLSILIANANSVATHPPTFQEDDVDTIEPLFDFSLQPK